MNRDDQKRRRTLNPMQMSLRSLFLFMMVLGPLMGWYVPQMLVSIQSLFQSRPAPVVRSTPLPASRQQQQVARLTVQERIAEQEAEMEIQREMIARAREEQRRRMERPRRINPNGTFNMRFHHTPSD